MNKVIYTCFLFCIIFGCRSKSIDNNLYNTWMYTESRDKIITDGEYNFIRSEPARDSAFLNISKELIKIRFKIDYVNDSLTDYDTTTIIPYKKRNNLLLAKINSKEYKVSYSIQDNNLSLQEIDQNPVFIKNSLGLLNKDYVVWTKGF